MEPKVLRAQKRSRDLLLRWRKGRRDKRIMKLTPEGGSHGRSK